MRAMQWTLAAALVLSGCVGRPLEQDDAPDLMGPPQGEACFFLGYSKDKCLNQRTCDVLENHDNCGAPGQRCCVAGGCSNSSYFCDIDNGVICRPCT